MINNTKPVDEKNAKRPARKPSKKKVCLFCVDKINDIDYKDSKRLRKFISESGKIAPRRTSGVCAKHQRALSIAIKRARVMAILPFVGGDREW